MMDNSSRINSHDTVNLKAYEFSIVEYTVFALLLGLSFSVGIYYGFIKKGHHSRIEYFLGGKKMGVLPVAISMITSHISGVSLLGVPAEIYDYGIQYLAISTFCILVAYLTTKLFLPVFYPLQLNSLYEYLELRFSKKVRKVASLFYATSTLLEIPIIIYIPSLAFNQVSGIPINYFAPVISVICIFYTTVGGLRSVVWTDVIQGFFTTMALITVIVLGIIDSGGVTNVYKRNSEGKRLEFFNMDLNPLARYTFWTVSLGGFFSILNSLAINPSGQQRFISVPTINGAKRSIYLFAFGLIIMKLLCVSVGLLMYSKYHACDPVKAGVVEKSGKLVLYYVHDVASSFPVLPGVFMSGLISAALSTMSAGLNTMSGTIYEDFISQHLNEKNREERANFFMKIIVVLSGAFCMFMVIFVVNNLGVTIIQMVNSIYGVFQGAIIAVFIMGLFIPRVNSKGAFCGLIVSVLVVASIATRANIAMQDGDMKYDKKPVDVSQCSNSSILNSYAGKNSSIYSNYIEVARDVKISQNLSPIFALSFMYYNMLGAIISLIVGCIVSYFSSDDRATLNPKLITPMMRPYSSPVSISDHQLSDLLK